MNYKSVVVTQRGSPRVLQIVENDLRRPRTAEARIKTLAAAVSLPDVEARYGRSPFPPKPPFTPGYAIVGEVDAIGENSPSPCKPGDRVAALTVYGGYSEYVYFPVNKLIPVPASLDPVQVVPLVLNYIVAYQTLHRTAKVEQGKTALIIGASGGIGTALLQLGCLAGLRIYGIASKSKHAVLRKFGATPIDYKREDFVRIIQKLEPGGIDYVFDGMGGEYLARGFGLLRRGGVWVGYANPFSRKALLRLMGQFLWLNLLPNGRTLKLYGTGASFLNMRPFLQDWGVLFTLLEEGKIAPLIMAKFPILEAVKANELLESGQVVGNLVLVAPALEN